MNISYSKGENGVIENHDVIKIDRLSDWNSTCTIFTCVLAKIIARNGRIRIVFMCAMHTN